MEERQPHRILIAFGVNAIPLMSEEEFMDEYDILVDELTEASPDSKIVIQCILPVAWWKHESMPYLTLTVCSRIMRKKTAIPSLISLTSLKAKTAASLLNLMQATDCTLTRASITNTSSCL